MPMPQQQQLAFSVPQCLPALLPVNQQGQICPSLVCLISEYAAGEQLVQHGSVQYVQQGVEAAAAQLTTSLSYRARSFVVVGLFALVPCFVVRSLRFLSRGNKAAFCFKQPGGGSFECLDETTNISTYLSRYTYLLGTSAKSTLSIVVVHFNTFTQHQSGFPFTNKEMTSADTRQNK